MPPSIVRAVSMLRSSPTPEGRCCPIQPTAGQWGVLAMVRRLDGRDRSDLLGWLVGLPGLEPGTSSLSEMDG